jgi:DNA-binding MarR family transcriptional regulator
MVTVALEALRGQAVSMTVNKPNSDRRSESQARRPARTRRIRRRRASDADRRLASLLDRTNEAVLKFRSKELAPSGLSNIEAAVLCVLDEAGISLTPADIARSTMRESHSTSKLLKRMEARGLITRRQDPVRGNMVRISMTDEGREAYQHSLLTQHSVRHPIAILSDRQKKQLEDLLKKLLQTSTTAGRQSRNADRIRHPHDRRPLK